MSMAALIQATVTHLRATLSLPAEQCDAAPGGRPPAMAGERFVAVSEGEWQSNSYESLDEYYGVEVTISARTEVFPWDRRGELLTSLAAKSGVPRLGEWVRAAVHSNYDLMNAANSLIGSNANGFMEPLRLSGPGRLRPVQPDWFQAETKSASPEGVGIVLVVPFQRARRIQGIENQLLEFQP